MDIKDEDCRYSEEEEEADINTKEQEDVDVKEVVRCDDNIV